MKKAKVMILCLALLFTLMGCGINTTENGTAVAGKVNVPNNSNAVDMDKTSEVTSTTHTTGFDGEKLYTNVNGEILLYERYEAGIGSLTPDALLDTFEEETEIEGIVWEVYSAKEYPDLSYVLVISGTNSEWTYRIVK